MEEQLPTPVLELIALNLYLGSITMLFGIAIVALIIFRNGKFNWTKFLLITVLLIISGNLMSLWIWNNWTLGIDIMFGPIHLPTLFSIVIVGFILIKLFRLKILKSKTSA
ncbi:hypothetical protein [Ancylomarina sp. 16SWW S1-10-2]|uniref:hypothetical protein n=1 Tax=Ancylomarina sp. 16SWW S1-10-2 TaxID=2499681 RepID=UPI0012AD2E40|nr:hypothetical protein [Ancylomarina sp. 16SWW S1-10-2]MRT94653.1 hypothetical protein [Ancylomarina sp. 16SWW S1-10-2]